jgi:Holliday junction resolvase RusA-like endonuclease
MTMIVLPMPPSSNTMFVNGSRGRFRSQKYDEWIIEAGWELLRQRPRKIVGPVNLKFEFEEGRSKRKFDITNRIKAPEDLLVKHGIIEADDHTIVRRISLAWGQVEGVCVTIVPHEAQSSTAFPLASQGSAEG